MEQTKRSRAAELELGRFRDLIESLPSTSQEQHRVLEEVPFLGCFVHFFSNILLKPTTQNFIRNLSSN
nr:unnamed protein product [Haemonchus contortus]